MATNRDQERNELHRTIWGIANDLRGAVDGWDFKIYVLGTLFYKYISEDLAYYITNGEKEAGNENFDYSTLPDEDAKLIRDEIIEEKGYFILPSELFCNVVKKADKDETSFIKQIKVDFNDYATWAELKDLIVFIYDPYNKTTNKNNFYELSGRKVINNADFNVHIIVSN